MERWIGAGMDTFIRSCEERVLQNAVIVFGDCMRSNCVRSGNSFYST